MSADPGFNAEQYRLEPREHAKIYAEQISAELFEGVEPVARPRVVIFGGQPGAGKSAAVNDAQAELAQQGGSVSIEGDKLRQFHPKYHRLMLADDKLAAAYTDKDSGAWVEMALADARQRRVNVVVEGTFRRPEVVERTAADFRAAGYVVEARVLAVNRKWSEQGIFDRYEAQRAALGQGRMTTPTAHEAAYVGMLDSVAQVEQSKAVDRLSIYRRGGELLYSNEVVGGRWVRDAAAVQTLTQERDRPWTLQEHRSYLAGWDRIDAMMRRPGRDAAELELREVASLRGAARRGLMAETFLRDRDGREALREFPELAGAYQAMDALKGRLIESGGMKASREVLDYASFRAREQIARGIADGRMPVAARERPGPRKDGPSR